MPTDIYFAAQNVRISVDEDPDQVAAAFASADGVPFRLTSHGARGDVYVNPAVVAFWSASEPGREPEHAQESPPPATERGAVTDIWGKPLHGRRPR